MHSSFQHEKVQAIDLVTKLCGMCTQKVKNYKVLVSQAAFPVKVFPIAVMSMQKIF